jgi:hypothetical protein
VIISARRGGLSAALDAFVCMETLRQQSNKLVTLLAELTASGKVEWVRKSADINFVFCFAGHELVEFQLFGSEAAPVEPSEEIHGIRSEVRNITFLWLEGLDGWDTLLELLRAAPIDDERYATLYQGSVRMALEGIEKLSGGGI